MTDHRGVVINTHVLDSESGNVKWKLNSFILNDTINKVIDLFVIDPKSRNKGRF